MAEDVPLAPGAYDKSNEQRTRSILQQRIEDIEQILYGMRTSYGTFGLGETTISDQPNGTSHNVSVGYTTFVRIGGPTATWGISGIKGGEKGRLLVIWNISAYNMNIFNENANSDAENRIITTTASTMTTSGPGCVVLVYDGTSQRWRVISFET